MGLGFWFQGFGFRAFMGLGFRVQGLGFWVWGGGSGGSCCTSQRGIYALAANVVDGRTGGYPGTPSSSSSPRAPPLPLPYSHSAYSHSTFGAPDNNPFRTLTVPPLLDFSRCQGPQDLGLRVGDSDLFAKLQIHLCFDVRFRGLGPPKRPRMSSMLCCTRP